MLMRIDAGAPWHHAILSAIGEWKSPEETLEDGRQYRYVIGGEAFDWLLLAERLSEELNGALPPDAQESLLFNGILPEQLSDDEFKRLIGQDKYRAHLNYLYGVRVEEALIPLPGGREFTVDLRDFTQRSQRDEVFRIQLERRGEHVS